MSGRRTPLETRQVGRALLTSPNGNCSRCPQCRCGLLPPSPAWRQAAEMSAKSLQRTEAAPRAATCTGVNRNAQDLLSVQFLLVDQSRPKRQPCHLCHRLCSTRCLSCWDTLHVGSRVAGSDSVFYFIGLDHDDTKTLRFTFLFHINVKPYQKAIVKFR